MRNPIKTTNYLFLSTYGTMDIQRRCRWELIISESDIET